MADGGDPPSDALPQSTSTQGGVRESVPVWKGVGQRVGFDRGATDTTPWHPVFRRGTTAGY